MARVFNGLNQWLSYTAAAVASPPMTLACWFNVASTTGTYGLITFGGSTDAGGLTARGAAGGVVAAWSLQGGSYSESVSAAYSANTWNHGAAVFSSTSHRQAFLNGSSGSANTNARSPSVSRTGIGATARTIPSGFCNGSIMWPAIWNAVLTDDEIASLAAGAYPATIRPDALVFCPPLGGFDGDHDIDIVGGLSLTAVNTPTWTDDSPSGLIYPSVPIVGLGTAGGGGGSVQQQLMLLGTGA